MRGQVDPLQGHGQRGVVDGVPDVVASRLGQLERAALEPLGQQGPAGAVGPQDLDSAAPAVANRWPSRGSPRRRRTWPARASKEARMSTGSKTTNTRVLGESVCTRPPRPTPQRAARRRRRRGRPPRRGRSGPSPTVTAQRAHSRATNSTTSSAHGGRRQGRSERLMGQARSERASIPRRRANVPARRRLVSSAVRNARASASSLILRPATARLLGRDRLGGEGVASGVG